MMAVFLLGFAVGVLVGTGLGAAIVWLFASAKIDELRDSAELAEYERAFAGSPCLLQLINLEKLT